MHLLVLELDKRSSALPGFTYPLDKLHWCPEMWLLGQRRHQIFWLVAHTLVYNFINSWLSTKFIQCRWVDKHEILLIWLPRKRQQCYLISAGSASGSISSKPHLSSLTESKLGVTLTKLGLGSWKILFSGQWLSNSALNMQPTNDVSSAEITNKDETFLMPMIPYTYHKSKC